jgi:hypothetical protein
MKIIYIIIYFICKIIPKYFISKARSSKEEFILLILIFKLKLILN